MAFLSSFYPEPVVAGTTEGTFAEGDHSHELDELEATSIPLGKVLTATGSNTASWEDPVVASLNWASITEKPSTFPPSTHAASHAAGVKAFYSGLGANETLSEPVFICADNAGTAGNSITFSFNGSDDIDYYIAEWNALNPSNQATLISGSGEQIPDEGEEITLSGGVAAGGDPFNNINQNLGKEDRPKFDGLVVSRNPSTTALANVVHVANFVAEDNTNQAPLVAIGGTGNIEVYKDSAISKALAYGFAEPGQTATDDFIVSLYDPQNGGWRQRLRCAQNGTVSVFGNLVVRDNTGNETATFDAQGNLTANRTYDLPDRSGELMLVGDAPASHTHPSTEITGLPTASAATPQTLGVAAAGSSSDFARADHVHPMPTAVDVGAAQEAPEDGIIYGRKDALWVDITAPSNLQIRRGTAAEVAAITPLIGEPLWETDSKKLKIGDGVTLGGILSSKFPFDGTLRNPTGYGSTRPSPGSVFISPEVETVGGSFLGGPYVAGNARGFGAVDLQGQRVQASQVASGNLSFIAGSERSTASATSSSVLSSNNTVCSGSNSLAVGCTTKTISGQFSFSLNSNITQDRCVAFNGIADRRGMLAHGTLNEVAGFVGAERVQAIQLILKQRTTSATPANLVLDAAGGIESLVGIPSNIAMFGQIDICAIQETTGIASAHYIRKFGIQNVDGVTSLIGTVTTIGTDYESSAGMDVSITADNNTDVLNISVTGLSSTNLRWVGIIRATEVELA